MKIGFRRRAREELDVMPWLTLSEQEISRLATFNAEVSRGIVHTDEYAAEMAKLQRKFNSSEFAWLQ